MRLYVGVFQYAVVQVVKSIPVVNSTYGYVTFKKKELVQLPKPIVRRTLSVLAQYMSGEIKITSCSQLQTTWTSLFHLDKTVSLHKALVSPIKTKGGHDVVVCSAIDFAYKAKLTSVAVDQHVHWDKWDIFLKQIKRRSTQDKEEKYFVRNFRMTDSELVRRGIRVVRSSILPPVMVRTSFPVILDEAHNVVAIPHFKYLDRRYGVSAVVKYKPPLSLDFIVNPERL